MEVRVTRNNSALKESTFLFSKNLTVGKLGNEMFREILGASLGFHMYTWKEGRIRELVLLDYWKGNLPATLLNTIRFLQLVLYKIQAKAQMPY